jgi:hypothetical protein
MLKTLTGFILGLSLSISSIGAFAVNKAMYTYKNHYFSIQLPKIMTLRNEFTTPKKIKGVKETVIVLANYGAQNKKQAVSGKLDPQVRSIISVRKGKFSPETGPAVQITFYVDSIKQRRGMPINAHDRLDTYHNVKSVTLNGHHFKTYRLKIKNSPVIYTFYSGVIDDRLVSLIWTAYSKKESELNYYSHLATKSLASLKFYGYN